MPGANQLMITTFREAFDWPKQLKGKVWLMLGAWDLAGIDASLRCVEKINRGGNMHCESRSSLIGWQAVLEKHYPWHASLLRQSG